MAGYYIYQPVETDDAADAIVVADGFSWLALFSPMFWSIRHKLWELFILNGVLSLFFATLASPVVATITTIMWHITFGIMAGNIHAKFLEWRAYQLQAYIADSANDDAAFTQWIYGR
jgi:hypothetical protein